MAFILRKMMKSWESSKETQVLSVPDHPTKPPSPDLSHLNQEEINVITDVMRRQEMFERAEADRVRKIQEDLQGLQRQLDERSMEGSQRLKTVDLRLCRLCFKNKFADGVGRVCHDCQQRVCSHCGAFSKPRWNFKRNKIVRGRWRCKLCIARREALCRTGGWYHGQGESTDGGLGLRNKLPSNWDLDTDAGSSANQGVGTTNLEDSEAYPSGNRSDSELLHKSMGHRSTRRRSSVKYPRRFSLSQDPWGSLDRPARNGHDEGNGRQMEVEEDDDDQDSFDSLVLERKLSRRRRQEKRQRRRFRNGNDRVVEEEGSPTMSNENVAENSRSGLKTVRSPLDKGQGQVLDIKSRSAMTHSHSVNLDRLTKTIKTERIPATTTFISGSMTSAASLTSRGISLKSLVPCHDHPSHLLESKASLCDSSVTETSSIVSYVDSSISDAGTTSPVPVQSALRIIRQDAISLGSSCVSIASTADGSSRRGDSTYSLEHSERLVAGRTREINGVQSGMFLDVKVPVSKSEDAALPALAESMTRWVNSGFKDSYVVKVNSQPKDPPYGLQIVGGTLDVKNCALSVVTWVSSSLRANITSGLEVLEWNQDSLRGKTYDQIVTVTSSVHPHVLVVLNPLQRTENGDIKGENTIADGHNSRTSSTDAQGRPTKRRMLPRTPVEMKRAIRQVRGELQIKLSYNSSSASLAVTIAGTRRLGTHEQDGYAVLNPFIVIYMVPSRCDRETVETELRASDGHPELAQTFIFDSLSLNELMSKSVALCVWNCDDRGDMFLGEVLVDLVETDLSDQPVWYQLQDHDENSIPLPTRGHGRSTSISESLTSGSFHLFSPTVSPEVPSYRHPHSSPSSIVSATASPVPFSRVGSREFHLNSASQPDTFTTKVRKKMRNTVNKMSSLSLSDKKDCSDDSPVIDPHHKSSSKLDKASLNRSPNLLKRRQNSKEQSREYSSMDLLAPPKPLSRTNSASSFFLSEDEDSRGRFSISSVAPDRPPPEGDDITSILGPGQIPPKPSAETSVCGDIKVGFMVTKGQLEVDVICAAGLHKSGTPQAPDTYVKTYLVEGKKVIQRKKTLIVKASFDPVYRKRIKYSACNVHGRIMKIDVWERVGNFEKKVCRGEVLVKLDGLDLSTHTMAWYKLFEINATDYGSDEFLSSW